jgi:hypothetical protein
MMREKPTSSDLLVRVLAAPLFITTLSTFFLRLAMPRATPEEKDADPAAC